MKNIKYNINHLNTLCIHYHVERMYFFGSVLNPDFNEKSDIDLLVKFKKNELTEYFDNYNNFKEQLAILFGREVDLLEEQTLRNPILITSINNSKKLVYGSKELDMNNKFH